VCGARASTPCHLGRSSGVARALKTPANTLMTAHHLPLAHNRGQPHLSFRERERWRDGVREERETDGRWRDKTTWSCVLCLFPFHLFRWSFSIPPLALSFSTICLHFSI